MSRGRLPKRIVFGNFEGAVRKGRDGKKKELIDCVQSDVRAFGVSGNSKRRRLRQGCGMGKALTSFFNDLFPVQQTTSGIGHRAK